MIILGVNAFHGDLSAAIIRDGMLVAAAEEERFRRVKHWAGFPTESIAYCLQEARLSLSDVDHLAVNQNSRANFLRKIKYVATHSFDVGLLFERLKNRSQRKHVPELLSKSFPGQNFQGAFHNIEHHLAHLCSAFHVSPFDQAVVVSVDGFGDFAEHRLGLRAGQRYSD